MLFFSGAMQILLLDNYSVKNRSLGTAMKITKNAHNNGDSEFNETRLQEVGSAVPPAGQSGIQMKCVHQLAQGLQCFKCAL